MKMEPAPTVPVYGIVVEKDVDVPMRDGARLKADRVSDKVIWRPNVAGFYTVTVIDPPDGRDRPRTTGRRHLDVDDGDVGPCPLDERCGGRCVVGRADHPDPTLADGMHDWVLANEHMAAVLAAKGYQ